MTVPGTLLFIVLGLAGILSLSAVMKWRDPRGSVEAVVGFRVPPRLVPAVSVGLPIAELALAVGLLLLPGVLFALVAWLVFLLFAAFSLVVGSALARGETPRCHCFGRLSAEPIGRGTVMRNIVLSVLALTVAIVLGNPAWPGLLGVIASLRGDLLVEVVMLVAIASTFALLWIRLARLRADLAAQSARLKALEAASAPLGSDPAPAEFEAPEHAAIPEFAPTAATTQAAWDDAELPAAHLLTSDGTDTELRAAASGPGPRALVFWRSDCAYCASILPEVSAASAEGRAVVVTTSEPEAVRQQGITGPLFVSPDRAALAAMQVPGTPVGFLVEGHRVVSGPFIGADAVRELVTPQR